MSVPTLPAVPGARGAPEHAVREQIVLAARAHFRLYGFEKTTVSDLATAIGYSKAYIYKFFDSKQAIGEVICTHCLEAIIEAIEQSVATADTASDALRSMFRTLVDATSSLFSEDRKLFDIASVAVRDRWPVVDAYERNLAAALTRIVKAGRKSGEFERKTTLHETVTAVSLVMQPYANPLLLQYHLYEAKGAAEHLSKLVLRSLAA